MQKEFMATLPNVNFCRLLRTAMQNATPPFQALPHSLLMKQNCFRDGHASVWITNSRKAVLWFCTGCRKGGKVLPIQPHPPSNSPEVQLCDHIK